MPDHDTPDLDALEAMEKAATPGPWTSKGVGGLHMDGTMQAWEIEGPHDGKRWPRIFRSAAPFPSRGEDAALIAAARNALPALLRAARERDELRTRLVEEHEGNTAREEARLWERRAGEKETEAYLAIEDVKRLRARAERAEARVKELEALMSAFMAKWAQVEPIITTAFFVAFQNRGMPYSGPTIEAELTAIRAYLAQKETR